VITHDGGIKFARIFAKEPQWRKLAQRLPAAGLLPDNPKFLSEIAEI